MRRSDPGDGGRGRGACAVRRLRPSRKRPGWYYDADTGELVPPWLARSAGAWANVALRLALVLLVLVVTWRVLPASGRAWVRSVVDRAVSEMEAE